MIILRYIMHSAADEIFLCMVSEGGVAGRTLDEKNSASNARANLTQKVID